MLVVMLPPEQSREVQHSPVIYCLGPISKHQAVYLFCPRIVSKGNYKSSHGKHDYGEEMDERGTFKRLY
jgi:hypothetical protein